MPDDEGAWTDREKLSFYKDVVAVLLNRIGGKTKMESSEVERLGEYVLRVAFDEESDAADISVAANMSVN